jgi:hypothetical protein
VAERGIHPQIAQITPIRIEELFTPIILMHLKRKRIPNQGDVVLLEFPGARLTKRGPAVVLSSAEYHAERPDVVVVRVSKLKL